MLLINTKQEMKNTIQGGPFTKGRNGFPHVYKSDRPYKIHASFHFSTTVYIDPLLLLYVKMEL
jgi:hypothetical protein